MTEQQAFEHLSFYGDDLTCERGGRVVFSDLSFALSSGQALLLRGPNGSGKSSLLRLLAGFLAPTRGGFGYKHGPDKEAISLGYRLGDFTTLIHYVGHQTALKPVFTARETLTQAAALFGHDHQLVDDALNALNLGALADLSVRYFSEGQQRRLALARLIASPRPIWLLDEPTNGLDADSAELLTNLMKQHLTNGGMIIAATHLEMDIDANTLNLKDFLPRQNFNSDTRFDWSMEESA